MLHGRACLWEAEGPFCRLYMPCLSKFVSVLSFFYCSSQKGIAVAVERLSYPTGVTARFHLLRLKIGDSLRPVRVSQTSLACVEAET